MSIRNNDKEGVFYKQKANKLTVMRKTEFTFVVFVCSQGPEYNDLIHFKVLYSSFNLNISKLIVITVLRFTSCQQTRR